VADDSKEQHSKERTKAEAQFKQAQKPQPATLPTTEAGRAKAEYVTAGHAERAKTARLKALRLANEAARPISRPRIPAEVRGARSFAASEL
jgi:hypothetical protein